MSGELAGRTVLVTGATSGIGLSCACRLAKLGARLVLTGRNPDTLSGAVPEAVDAIRIEVDFAREDSGAFLASELRKQTVSLDGCVFGAGVNSMRPPKRSFQNDSTSVESRSRLPK